MTEVGGSCRHGECLRSHTRQSHHILSQGVRVLDVKDSTTPELYPSASSIRGATIGSYACWTCGIQKIRRNATQRFKVFGEAPQEVAFSMPPIKGGTSPTDYIGCMKRVDSRRIPKPPYEVLYSNGDSSLGSSCALPLCRQS